MIDKEKIQILIDADEKAYNAVKTHFDNTMPSRLKNWLDAVRKESEGTK